MRTMLLSFDVSLALSSKYVYLPIYLSIYQSINLFVYIYLSFYLLKSNVVLLFKVCIVITKNRSLHSAMNFYLISLAVSDLVIIILGIETKCYVMLSNILYMCTYTYSYVCIRKIFSLQLFSFFQVLLINWLSLNYNINNES